MIQIITRYGNLLLLAMGQTLLLALCGLFFACILGMFFGLLSVLKNKACRIISSIFVDVIRGVPMIVLAYFIYFGVPYCLNNMMGIIAKYLGEDAVPTEEADADATETPAAEEEAAE